MDGTNEGPKLRCSVIMSLPSMHCDAEGQGRAADRQPNIQLLPSPDMRPLAKQLLRSRRDLVHNFHLG